MPGPPALRVENRFDIFLTGQHRKQLFQIERIVTMVMPPTTLPSVRDAFAHCEEITRNHYENFPVASFFLPGEQRAQICAIYAFARTADDFADEGTMAPAERLRRLDAWGEMLDDAFRGRAVHPVFVALAETAERTGISRQLLADLLTAFRMDVTIHRYATYHDLLEYCRHSANPVGRLVLQVFGASTGRTAVLSDAICTALQLANFWQDVAVDLARDRIYIPLEDFRLYEYTEHDLQQKVADDRFRRLLAHQVERTRALFEAGRPLLQETVDDLRLEIALTWHGGMTILDKIERAGYDVLGRRPAITTMDKISILMKILSSGRA